MLSCGTWRFLARSLHPSGPVRMLRHVFLLAAQHAMVPQYGHHLQWSQVLDLADCCPLLRWPLLVVHVRVQALIAMLKFGSLK